MNHDEKGDSGAFESLGTPQRRGVVDLEEIGTDVAKTRSTREAIDHPGAVAKLYE